MPKRRSSVRLKGKTLHANRLAIGEDSFVYVFVANRPYTYKPGTHGKSRIVYMGTTSRQHVQMWRKLERALLLAFKEKYGRTPKANADVKKDERR